MPFTDPPPPPPTPPIRIANPDGTQSADFIAWLKRLDEWFKRLAAAIP